MTWKNDSNAYEVKPTYGSIEEQLKTASQKWMTKNHDAALEQTRKHIASLPSGEHRFQYPFVITEIIAADPSLHLVDFDRLNQIVVIRKD